MFFWGLMAPIFGLFADKYGGNKAVFLGFLVFGLGIFLLFNGPNTGIYFQLSLGVGLSIMPFIFTLLFSRALKRA